jgi:ATP synthase subunit 6
MCFQPFEVFEINLTSLRLRDFLTFNFYITNSILTLILLTSICITISLIVLYDNKFIPSLIRWFLNALIIFTLQQVKNQIGHRPTPWFSLFILYFIFVLSADYIGLLPFSFTLTSQFNFVLIPSFSIFIGQTILIVIYNFIPFLSHFVPEGIPKAIGLFLFNIEIISYLFRAISLPVRVFANMVAGHVLLFLMSTALLIHYEAMRGLVLKCSFIFILTIWIAVFHLELLVAGLQAYVFLTMISIYSKDLGTQNHPLIEIKRRILFLKNLYKRTFSIWFCKPKQVIVFLKQKMTL